MKPTTTLALAGALSCALSAFFLSRAQSFRLHCESGGARCVWQVSSLLETKTRRFLRSRVASLRLHVPVRGVRALELRLAGAGHRPLRFRTAMVFLGDDEVERLERALQGNAEVGFAARPWLAYGIAAILGIGALAALYGALHLRRLARR